MTMTKASTTSPQSTLIRAQIEKANTDHAALSASLPKLEQQRTDALITDDMPAVDAAEREIAAARVQLGRLRERVALLESRLAEAVDAEANQSAEQLRAKAEAVRDAALVMLRTDYLRLSHALAEVLTKLAGAEQFIVHANQRIGERSEQVDGINASIRYRPVQDHAEIQRYWVFSNGRESERISSIDGSKHPPRPERRSLGVTNEAGEWQFDEPRLVQRTIRVRDADSVFLEDIDQSAMLPGLEIGDRDIWGEEQREAARADFERIAESLLPADGSPDRPAKRARNALAA